MLCVGSCAIFLVLRVFLANISFRSLTCIGTCTCVADCYKYAYTCDLFMFMCMWEGGVGGRLRKGGGAGGGGREGEGGRERGNEKGREGGRE